MKYDVKMVCTGDGSIGWRLFDDGLTADEWSDVLEEVTLGHAPAQLTGYDLRRWQEACEAGQGPDADVDVNGVRWVVRSDV